MSLDRRMPSEAAGQLYVHMYCLYVIVLPAVCPRFPPAIRIGAIVTGFGSSLKVPNRFC